MGQIITLTGPSGAGKSTLMARLCALDAQFVPLKGAVTRSPRGDDMPGKHEYVSRAEFDRLNQSGELLGVSQHHGNWYATRRNDVLTALHGDATAIADLNLVGAEAFTQLAREQGRQRCVIHFYLSIRDEAELERRLRSRGETDVRGRIEECRMWERQAFEVSLSMVFIDGTASVDRVVESVQSALGGRS